jgi:hypothetical protein
MLNISLAEGDELTFIDIIKKVGAENIILTVEI